MITIRQIVAGDWQVWRELRLDALRDAPGAFKTKLVEWQGDGDIEPLWRDRLSAVPFNVIADLDRKPAGMVSAVKDGDDVEVISMWVAPFARGRGIGDALIDAVLGWEVAERAGRIGLCVMEGNDHAAALYRRHGFVDAGQGQPADAGGCIECRMIRVV
jgi:ribosomal protein S18 acetylase RimI-like enzyme